MPDDNSINRAWRPADYAGILGISRARLYELIGNGTIIARKLDRRTLIFDQDNKALRASLPRLHEEKRS